MGQVSQNVSKVGNVSQSGQSGQLGRNERREQLEVQLRHLPADQLDLVAEVVAALTSANVHHSTETAQDLQRLLTQERPAVPADALAEEADEADPAQAQLGSVRGARAGAHEDEWEVRDLMTLAESSLQVEWDTPEEDAAWAHLADLPTR